MMAPGCTGGGGSSIGRIFETLLYSRKNPCDRRVGAAGSLLSYTYSFSRTYRPYNEYKSLIEEFPTPL